MYFTARRAISHTEGIRFIEKRTLQNAKSFFLAIADKIDAIDFVIQISELGKMLSCNNFSRFDC